MHWRFAVEIVDSWWSLFPPAAIVTATLSTALERVEWIGGRAQ